MKVLPPMQRGYWTVWVATLLFFAAFYLDRPKKALWLWAGGLFTLGFTVVNSAVRPEEAKYG